MTIYDVAHTMRGVIGNDFTRYLIFGGGERAGRKGWWGGSSGAFATLGVSGGVWLRERQERFFVDSFLFRFRTVFVCDERIGSIPRVLLLRFGFYSCIRNISFRTTSDFFGAQCFEKKNRIFFFWLCLYIFQRRTSAVLNPARITRVYFEGNTVPRYVVPPCFWVF